MFEYTLVGPLLCLPGKLVVPALEKINKQKIPSDKGKLYIIKSKTSLAVQKGFSIVLGRSRGVS